MCSAGDGGILPAGEEGQRAGELLSYLWLPEGLGLMAKALQGVWKPLFNPSHPGRTGRSKWPSGKGGNLGSELPWDIWDKR